MTRVREWDSGISFIRDHPGEASLAVIGLAIGGDQQVTVEGIPNGLYRDAVSGNEVQVDAGRIGFSVKGNSAGIYVLDGPGKIGDDGMYLR